MNQPKVHPVDFADNLYKDEELKNDFVNSYIEEYVNALDLDDLKKELKEFLFEEKLGEISTGNSDSIVEEAMHYTPDLCEKYGLI